MITHIDELPAEANTDLVQQEFLEIVSLVEIRYMFLNTIDGSQESRGRALDQFMRLTKLTLKILCYRNNAFKSEAFLPGLFGEICGDVYLYRAPDLNLYNPSQHTTTPELSNLFGDQANNTPPPPTFRLSGRYFLGRFNYADYTFIVLLH